MGCLSRVYSQMRVRDVTQDALEQIQYVALQTSGSYELTFWNEGLHSGMPLTLYQYSTYFMPSLALCVPARLMLKKLLRRS